MGDYNEIIDALTVRLLKAKNIQLLNSVIVKDYYDVENHIFLLHDKSIAFSYFEDKELKEGEEELNGQLNGHSKPATPETSDQTRRKRERQLLQTLEEVEVGDILFVPGGKPTCMAFGLQDSLAPYASRLAEEGFDPINSIPHFIDNQHFISSKERYFGGNSDLSQVGKLSNSFSYLSFEAKVSNSINFFSSLDIPPLVIRDNPGLARIIKEIVQEDLQATPGKRRMLQNKMEQVVIEVIRHILRNDLFVEKLATNSTYFKDRRLVEVFKYIKENLGGDLSNKVLANVANISEDYVGQYFKKLTNINPQDYIEYQRMEHAVHLLRTTDMSIRDIGQEVGYKDTAYFCRRFKMMFGIPAGKMRRRDTAVNI
ncbi:helix-turn-helix transcriptional regulator [Eisenibacter elegans]|uniref:helix-turn-helix transcriptional regulator n=1 Tax=Eisenibacter elegans TaxID=997 RepID=UPI0004157649|nr:AraC family transcriptional regulator [Eisenibacter elegans]